MDMADGKKGEVVYEIRADDSQLEGDLNAANEKVEKKAGGGMEKLKSIAGGAAKAIGTGMVAAGTAAVGLGAAAVSSAVDVDQAMNQFIAATGLAKDGTDYWQKSLEQIYKDNYGENFEDIADAMATVKKEVGALDDAELTNLTESAFALRDTFDYDITESARAAKAMMDSFGTDGEAAFNLIAAGAQNGLDYSGELIDSISEYSVQFAKMGLDADDMFNIFQAGADSGAWNLDKIGDAVKEMSIRVIDGSETTKEGFEAIGLNADDMAAKFAAGGDSARDAFQQTISALAEMGDPLAQNTAGVNLFGTMWEDLGPEVVSQLANITDGAYDAEGALNGIKEVKYDDLGSMFEGLKRSVELLLLPLGEQLIPILSELIDAVLPLLEEALPPIVDAVGELITQLAPVIEEILPVLMDLINSLLPPLMDIINAVLPIIVQLFQELLPPITEIISAVLPVLLDLINALLPIFQVWIDMLMPIIDLFMELLTPILQLISEALNPLIEALAPIVELMSKIMIPVLETLMSVFGEVFRGIADVVSGSIKNITNIIKNILDFIKNVFTGNWKGAWENIKNIFKSIADTLGGIFKAPINFIIDLINGFIKGINKIKLPDWVPGIGGKGFNIPTIPRLKTGIDFVPGDFFPAYLDYGERVLTREENMRFNAAGGLEGLERSLSGGNYVPDQKIVLGKGCIVVQTNLDGRTAATVMAPYMDTELGSISQNKERGQ